MRKRGTPLFFYILIQKVERGIRSHIYHPGTLERLVLSDRPLVAYVPLPATSGESVPGDIYARMPTIHDT